MRPHTPQTRGQRSTSVSASNAAIAAPSDRSAPLGDLARHVAFQAITRQCKLWPDCDLQVMDRLLESPGGPMSDLDRAFATAIYDTTIRRWTSLEFLIQRFLSQPLSEVEPRLRAALLAGAAQVVFMDKSPAHAAINHAVEWAKIVVRPGAGKMANAVLRRVAILIDEDRTTVVRDRWSDKLDEFPTESGGAVGLLQEVLPADPLERLALATSCPLALIQHWSRAASMADARALALHTLARPPVVLNVRHAAAALPPALQPHESPGHMVWTGTIVELAAILNARSDIWVQDAASSQAIESVMDLSPRVVVDVCAGQGTKTRQLLATFPQAQVIVSESDRTRLQALRERFAAEARVRVIELAKLPLEIGSTADLVVLDVPCSNTGVLARRPEAKHRFDSAHLESLVSLQKQIMADSIVLLRESPRGKILYSTCSLESQENSEQAAWVAKWHRFTISRERFDRPRGLPGGVAAAYADGSYSALLE